MALTLSDFNAGAFGRGQTSGPEARVLHRVDRFWWNLDRKCFSRQVTNLWGNTWGFRKKSCVYPHFWTMLMCMQNLVVISVLELETSEDEERNAVHTHRSTGYWPLRWSIAFRGTTPSNLSMPSPTHANYRQQDVLSPSSPAGPSAAPASTDRSCPVWRPAAEVAAPSSGHRPVWCSCPRAHGSSRGWQYCRRHLSDTVGTSYSINSKHAAAIVTRHIY